MILPCKNLPATIKYLFFHVGYTFREDGKKVKFS